MTTIGALKKLAPSYPVPKDEDKKEALTNALKVGDDPAPTQAASAGVQAAAQQSTEKITLTTKAVVEKQRLFANPERENALRAGGEEQLLNTTEAGSSFKSYFTQVYGLKRSDVTIKKLGARTSQRMPYWMPAAW
mgnify:CR=1 FL=1